MDPAYEKGCMYPVHGHGPRRGSMDQGPCFALSRVGCLAMNQGKNMLQYNTIQYQIDCKAGTTAEGQNLLANNSTSRASLL